MKDDAPGMKDRAGNDDADTVRVELPREACETLSDMCALLADLIADTGCGCEACEERVAQADAWEGVFRGMAEAEPGTTHEAVPGPEGYVH